MVEDPLNEDQWLYGDSDGNELQNGNTEEPSRPETLSEAPPAQEEEEIQQEENEVQNEEQESFNMSEPSIIAPAGDIRPPGEELEEGEDEESDDSDDNVQVTIGDIKAAPQYGNLNIKRNTLINTGIEKQRLAGKFSIDDFESIGTINGVPAHEYSIDALEDKPWRKPGADITDYFNYGFNEETWRAYCERQKSMRVRESGVGLGGLGMSRTTTTVFTGDGVKHGSVPVVVGRKAGPPPEPRRAGIIEVIGSASVASRRTNDSAEEENAIQVLTADKRDYGRKVGYDMSVPPPNFDASIPPVVGYGPYPGAQEFYPADIPDPYYQHYERSNPGMGWIPPDSKPKEITLPEGVVIKQEPQDKPPKTERERERDRDRHKDRHRHRTRSRSPERRSSRKHKSRSRSPGHRSHKKKKSKKSERDRSRERERSRSHERSRDRERSHTRDLERSHTRDREPSDD